MYFDDFCGMIDIVVLAVCLLRLVYGFQERLQISKNPLIETLKNSSTWRTSGFLQLYEKYLYLPKVISSNSLVLW